MAVAAVGSLAVGLVCASNVSRARISTALKDAQTALDGVVCELAEEQAVCSSLKARLEVSEARVAELENRDSHPANDISDATHQATADAADAAAKLAEAEGLAAAHAERAADLEAQVAALREQLEGAAVERGMSTAHRTSIEDAVGLQERLGELQVRVASAAVQLEQVEAARSAAEERVAQAEILVTQHEARAAELHRQQEEAAAADDAAAERVVALEATVAKLTGRLEDAACAEGERAEDAMQTGAEGGRAAAELQTQLAEIHEARSAAEGALTQAQARIADLEERLAKAERARSEGALAHEATVVELKADAAKALGDLEDALGQHQAAEGALRARVGELEAEVWEARVAAEREAERVAQLAEAEVLNGDLKVRLNVAETLLEEAERGRAAAEENLAFAKARVETLEDTTSGDAQQSLEAKHAALDTAHRVLLGSLEKAKAQEADLQDRVTLLLQQKVDAEGNAAHQRQRAAELEAEVEEMKLRQRESDAVLRRVGDSIQSERVAADEGMQAAQAKYAQLDTERAELASRAENLEKELQAAHGSIQSYKALMRDVCNDEDVASPQALAGAAPEAPSSPLAFSGRDESAMLRLRTTLAQRKKEIELLHSELDALRQRVQGAGTGRGTAQTLADTAETLAERTAEVEAQREQLQVLQTQVSAWRGASERRDAEIARLRTELQEERRAVSMPQPGTHMEDITSPPRLRTPQHTVPRSPQLQGVYPRSPTLSHTSFRSASQPSYALPPAPEYVPSPARMPSPNRVVSPGARYASVSPNAGAAARYGY